MNKSEKSLYYIGGLALISLLPFLIYLAWNTGITRDEFPENEVALQTLKYLRAGAPINYSQYYETFNDAYYGELFNLFALPFQSLFATSMANEKVWLNTPQIYAIKHVLILLTGLLNVFFLQIAFMRSNFSRVEAILYSLLLPTCLYFLGHSFMNNKDIPFATLFTLSSFVMGFIFSSKKEIFTTKNSIIIGFSIGLCACIRFGGLIQLAHLLILILATKLHNKNAVPILRKLLPFYILAIFVALAVTYIGYPATWRNPGIFWEIFNYLKKIPVYGGPIYLMGNVLSAENPVWYYIPLWWFLKMPLLLIIGLSGYYLALIFNFKRILEKPLELIFLLQMVTIPLVAILSKSIVYNGLRHFLFIFPAAVFLSALFLKHVSFKRKKIIYPLVCAHFTISLMDLNYLRTHSYTYFNEIGRLLKVESKMERDYWGESSKELAKKLEIHMQSEPEKYLIVGHKSLFAPYLSDDYKIWNAGDYPEFIPKTKTFYYATHLKYGSPGHFLNCPKIDEVKVSTWGGDEYTLGIIRRCTPELMDKAIL